jgi:light-regulated signal transduction histidine kinase (bacteriophytochrome)
MERLPGVNCSSGRKGEQEFWWHSNAKSQHADDRKIAWIEGVAEDITEQKVLEVEM